MKIEKFTEQQRELFGEFGGGQGRKKPPRTLGREEKFSLSVSLDALLLFGILLLMVAVLIYSTGVEIGRHRVKRLPAKVVQAPESTSRVSPSPPAPPKAPVQPPSPAGGYTIQILSYRETGPAGRSLETLRKQGYSAFLLSGSRGVAVCVGTFARASEAQQTLKELRKLYPDCFVRKR